MQPTDLSTLLRQMLIDIQDPECFYWLYTSYFDIQPPSERTLTRWWQAPLFLDHDSVWNAEFADDGMLCDVILKQQLSAKPERIKIPYSQLYRITRYMKGKPVSEKDCQLYYDHAKFQMPPLS